MSAYDSRRVMLDAGLTALALRALHERDGHYPFVDPYTARRRSHSGHQARPTTHPVSRRERASQWFGPWFGLWRHIVTPRLGTLWLRRLTLHGTAFESDSR
jgi:hypothetical protein